MRFIFKRIVFAIFLLSLVQETSACGGGDYEEFDYQYFFMPELLSDHQYDNYFPLTPYCDRCTDLLPTTLVDEWAVQYPQVKKEDIQEALFTLLTKQQTKQLLNGLSTPNNSFFRYLLANNQGAVLRYLDFLARANELTDKEWYWDEEERDTPGLDSLITEAKSLIKEAKGNVFLQQRYVFQIVKLLLSSGHYEEAISYYDEHVLPSFPLNLTYYRTLGYKAGAIRKSGDILQAKYIFGVLFANCPSIRYMAYLNFKYIDLENEEEWGKCLEKAKNKEESAALWAVKNIYDDQLDIHVLKELYASDPGSVLLELALIRQLNNFHSNNYLAELRSPIKLDSSKVVLDLPIDDCGSNFYEVELEKQNWLVSWWHWIVRFFQGLFGSIPSPNPSASHEAKLTATLQIPFYYQSEWTSEWIDLLEKVNEEGKVKNPMLFRLALGYLHVVNGNFDKGERLISEVARAGTNSQMVKMAEYLVVWSNLARSSKVSQELEGKIIAYLKTVQSKGQREEDLLNELSRRYLIEQQYDKYYVLGRTAPVFFNCNILDGLLQKTNTKQEGAFFAHFGKIDAEQIKVFYAATLLKMGKFKEAALMHDGVISVENDNGEEKSISYSELAKLEEKGNANSLLRIADDIAKSNNWGYNQYSWAYFRYYYSGAETGVYPFNVPGLAETMANRIHLNNRRELGTELAEKYYRKAHDLFTSKEQKAEVLFKAQQIAIEDRFNIGGKTYYYKELTEKYADTRFYQNAYNSCSFLRNEEVYYWY